MRTFDTDPDAPLAVSPELVLVSPPDVARAAREALEPPSLADDIEPLPNLAKPVPVAEHRPAPPVHAPAAAPAPAERRSRAWVVLLAVAIALVASGFFAGRELSGRTSQSASEVAPTATAPAPSAPEASAPPETAASPTSSEPSTRPALPVVSWKPRPGIRRYRFDLVTGRVAILTIVTDEPRAQLPLSWPNAGQRRHLAPGRYTWRGSPAPGAAGLTARGAVTIPKSSQS